jgi:hypothetical protein
MKKIIMVVSSVIGACLSLSAMADMTPTSAPAAPASMQMGMGMGHPCKSIFEACKSAGFVKHGPAGRGMLENCIKPILMGQSVPGVTVSPDDVSACKAKHAHPM